MEKKETEEREGILPATGEYQTTSVRNYYNGFENKKGPTGTSGGWHTEDDSSERGK